MSCPHDERFVTVFGFDLYAGLQLLRIEYIDIAFYIK